MPFPSPPPSNSGALLKRPIMSLLPGPTTGTTGAATAPCAFYTAAINEDVGAVVSSAVFGAKYTPHLKIKVNADVAFW